MSANAFLVDAQLRHQIMIQRLSVASGKTLILFFRGCVTLS